MNKIEENPIKKAKQKGLGEMKGILRKRFGDRWGKKMDEAVQKL